MLERFVPARGQWVLLGELREKRNAVSNHGRKGDDVDKAIKSDRYDARTRSSKDYYEELHPFLYHADSRHFSDDAVCRLMPAGDPIDMELEEQGRVWRFQITTSRVDVREVFPHFAHLGSPGYQEALATEVMRREGFASDDALYERRNGVATVIEETEIARSGECYLRAARAGLLDSLRVKKKHDGSGAELIVWHSENLETYSPDYLELVRGIWSEVGENIFDATYFQFGSRCVKCEGRAEVTFVL